MQLYRASKNNSSNDRCSICSKAAFSTTKGAMMNRLDQIHRLIYTFATLMNMVQFSQIMACKYVSKPTVPSLLSVWMYKSMLWKQFSFASSSESLERTWISFMWRMEVGDNFPNSDSNIKDFACCTWSRCPGLRYYIWFVMTFDSTAAWPACSYSATYPALCLMTQGYMNPYQRLMTRNPFSDSNYL